MRQPPLEVVQSLDGGPLPLRQDAGAVDQDVALVDEGRAVFAVVQGYVPESFEVVPFGFDDFGVEDDEGWELVLRVEAEEVVLDLGGVGVVAAPVGVGVEGELFVLSEVSHSTHWIIELTVYVCAGISHAHPVGPR